MADRLTSQRRSWNMSRIRGQDTKPEITLRSILHRAGFRFRLQDRNLPGRPDIVLKKYRTVIMVHGCFWHRHQGCRNATMPSTRTEFWSEKFAGTVERDKRVIKELNALGWLVITVWECALERDPERVLLDICGQLRGELHGV